MSFYTIHSENEANDRSQDLIAREFSKLGKNVFANAAIVQVTLATTALPVFHSLGFTPQGFIVIDRTNAGIVQRSGTSATPQQTMNLFTSIAGTFTLLFF